MLLINDYERIRSKLQWKIVKIAIDDTKLTTIDINDANGLGTVYFGIAQDKT